jgi:enterochelin esterase family protein
VLDNLLAAGRIPPLVTVFVANPSAEARVRELSCHPPFAEFLTSRASQRGVAVGLRRKTG